MHLTRLKLQLQPLAVGDLVPHGLKIHELWAYPWLFMLNTKKYTLVLPSTSLLYLSWLLHQICRRSSIVCWRISCSTSTIRSNYQDLRKLRQIFAKEFDVPFPHCWFWYLEALRFLSASIWSQQEYLRGKILFAFPWSLGMKRPLILLGQSDLEVGVQ